MAGDDYGSTAGGKLKLKGVSNGRVDKKKKKKKVKPEAENDQGHHTEAQDQNADANTDADADNLVDRSVILHDLEDEDRAIAKDKNRETSLVGSTIVAPNEAGGGLNDDDTGEVKRHLQTEAQRRFEEQRRKRLEERLKREGVKTHKQRVEELNRYLSGLSEHHDMPKIGPG